MLLFIAIVGVTRVLTFSRLQLAWVELTQWMPGSWFQVARHCAGRVSRFMDFCVQLKLLVSSRVDTSKYPGIVRSGEVVLCSACQLIGFGND